MVSSISVRSKFRTRGAIACLALLVTSFFLAGTLIPSHSEASSSSIVLSLTTVPSILPADGGTYSSLVVALKNSSSGVPFIPSSNFTIFFSSSSPQIATLPSSLLFPAEASSISVNVSTTALPGNTTVTAAADGYEPSITRIETAVIGGMPTSLEVIPNPSVILPDRRINSSIFVEVVDILGNPVALGKSITVSLTSSDSQIGSVPNSVTIQAGECFATASFNPTYVAGSTTITATAANLASGSAVVSTTGPIPRRLVVSVAPGMISSNPKGTAILSIQLQDNNTQTPAIAPAPVSVVVTSNNTGVVAISNNPPIVTIPAGSSYTSLVVNSGGKSGVANITASAQGYIKGSTIVNATPASTLPNQLSLSFAPNIMLPDNETYPQAIVAQLRHVYQNGTSVPAINQSYPVTVYSRTSNNATMQVLSPSTNDQTISSVISKGSTYAVFQARTTFLPGTVEITAQSEGLGSVTLPLVSVGSTPNGMRLQLDPSSLPANQQTYRTISITLINTTTGTPEKAPNDTTVNLAETNAVVGTIQSTVIVPAGSTFAYASFTTSEFAGSTLITASAQNFTSTNATLTTLNKGATNLKLFAPSQTVVADGQQYNMLVQLQDPYGQPQKVDTNVTVLLSSSDESTGSVPSSVSIPAGSTFATFKVNSTYVPGSINITAFSTGFQSAQGGMRSIQLSDTAHLTVTASSLYFGKTAYLSLTVMTGNTPLTNASIIWSTKYGTLTSISNSTNSNGTATAEYIAGDIPGRATVVVQVSKVGYVTAITNVSVSIEAPPLPPQPTTQKPSGIMAITLFSIPVLFIIPPVVAAPIVAFFVIKRRSAGVGVDYGEEEI